MNATSSIARRKLWSIAALGGVMAATGCTHVTHTSVRADTAAATRAATIHSQASAPPADLARFLQPFPPAAPGQTRWVIDLPAQAHEDRIRVELLPSIRMRTDCNHHLASAKMQTHTVPGWGYSYQVMGDIGPVISTLMGCPESETRERDVPVHTDVPLQRYNSRAAIVFYAPAQVTLRYRLWRSEEEIQTAARALVQHP